MLGDSCVLAHLSASMRCPPSYPYIMIPTPAAASTVKVSLDAGNTLVIPTGWIHAVHTPVDSVSNETRDLW